MCSSRVGVLRLDGVGAALTPAAGQLGVQRVQPLRPQPPVAVEPLVDLAERLGVHRVQAAGARGAYGHETGLTEHPQVLRDGRLRDPELLLDDGPQLTRGPLAVGEQFEDAPADRVSEDVERVHGPTLYTETYISKD